jgi:hypothetical protein
MNDMGWRNGANRRPVKRWRGWVLLLTVIAAGLHIAVLVRETDRMGGQEGLSTLRLPDEGNYYLHCANLAAKHGWTFLRSEESLRSGPLPWMWLLLWGRNVAVCRCANIALVLLGSLLISLVLYFTSNTTIALRRRAAGFSPRGPPKTRCASSRRRAAGFRPRGSFRRGL